MPSRANASLLLLIGLIICFFAFLCQCPHGLMPHCYPKIPRLEKNKPPYSVSMPSRANASLLRSDDTDLDTEDEPDGVNALTG